MATNGLEARKPAVPDGGTRGGTRARWALVATSLGFSVVQLDVSVVNVAIKPIGADLGGGVTGLQWVVGAYTLAFAALILSAGALGDRIGARRVFVAGFTLFTAASAACGAAPSLGVLIAARTLQGIGAAVLVPCSLSLLNHTYREPRARAHAVGLWAAGASVALSAGPLAGGLLSSTLGWRSIFFINAPIGLAGFGVAAVALGAFAAIEFRRRRPMLPLSLFRSRTFSASSSIGIIINVAFYGLIFVLSLYLQTTRHYSVLLAGLAFAISIGLALLVAALAPGLDPQA